MKTAEAIRGLWSHVARLWTASPVIEEIEGTVYITDLDFTAEREIDVGSPKAPGGNKLVTGWSIGELSSGADIEIDERLEGLQLGVLPASNHIILSGKIASGSPIPPIARFNGKDWTGEAHLSENALTFRFDDYPLRIGRHVLRVEWTRTQKS